MCIYIQDLCHQKIHLCIRHSFRQRVEACAMRHKINYKFSANGTPLKKYGSRVYNKFR